MCVLYISELYEPVAMNDVKESRH